MRFSSILVTGGTGTFGRAFVERCLAGGISERICIYSRGEHAQADMRLQFKEDSRLRWFIGDVRDPRRLRRACQGIDLVVHAAALKRIEVGRYDPLEMTKTNIGGTSNVVEAASDAGVPKAILISSDKAHSPIGCYGATKLVAEELFLAANNSYPGTRYSVVRYGNVWGSNGSVVPKWRRMLQDGAEFLPVTDPNCTRFMMRVNDAVKLVLDTASDMRGGELAIPDLPAYRLGDLAEAMGAPVKVIGLPSWEKLHEKMSHGSSSEHARRMSVKELRQELAA